MGSYLAATGVRISHIFSSDLQRAFKTAEAIRLAQPSLSNTVTQLHLLREQDFGFYEGKHFHERPKGGDKSGREAHQEAHLNPEGFRDVESKHSMIARVEAFLDGHLVSLLSCVADDETIAVVAHGIILNYLWRGILVRFEPGNVSVVAGVLAGGNGMGLEYLGSWSNTGYLDLEVRSKVLPGPSLPATGIASTSAIEQSKSGSEALPLPSAKPVWSSSSLLVTGAESSWTIEQPIAIASLPKTEQVPDPTLPDGSASLSQTQSAIPGSAIAPAVVAIPQKLPNMSLAVRAVNGQKHLKGLKKTRGGIGSSRYDETQKTMDTFFKKQKLG